MSRKHQFEGAGGPGTGTLPSANDDDETTKRRSDERPCVLNLASFFAFRCLWHTLKEILIGCMIYIYIYEQPTLFG